MENVVDVTVDAEWMDRRICWHATARPSLREGGGRDEEMEVSEKGRALWGVCERWTDSSDGQISNQISNPETTKRL